MPDTLTCNCGFQVQFEDEDRGFEVYCPSCGSACEVPEADAAETVASQAEVGQVGSPTRSRRRASVFATEHESDVGTQAAGEVVCLCGTAIPVTVDDFGGAVYCPSCGNEVTVGEDFAQAGLHRARAAKDDDAARDAPKARFRFIRSPLGAAAVVLMLASTTAGAYFTWQNKETVLEAVGLAKPKEAEKVVATDEGEFDPAALTAEMIDDLTRDEDQSPWDKLMRLQAWARGLREHKLDEADERFAKIDEVSQQVLGQQNSQMVADISALAEAETIDDAEHALETAQTWQRTLKSCGLDEDDSRMLELDRVSLILIEKADPITIEMIAGLLDGDDAYEALVQAQTWKEALLDRGVAETDERLKRVDEVIAELERRLVQPPPPPPAYIAEFHEIVQRFADCLRQEDLRGAKQAKAAADALLQQHPEHLAHQARRFMSLKARLRQMLLIAEGVANIRNMLDEAEADLATDDNELVGSVVERRAKIKFYIPMTPVTSAEADEFDRRTKQISADLKFARGRRAVHDAARCNTAGDVPARNRAVRVARRLLPEFSADKVDPLLKEIEPWVEELNQATTVRDQEPKSELGRKLARRDELEAALDAMGNGDREQLIAVCVAAASQPDKTTDEHLKRLGNYLLNVVEADIEPLLVNRDRFSRAEVLARLETVRNTLNRATPWSDTPRWQSLDATTRGLSDEVAQPAIEEAIALAEQDKLQQAVDTISPAETLGSLAVRARAKRYKQEWLAELKIRADNKLAAETWRKIKASTTDGTSQLVIWHHLARFLRRYPASEHAAEARQMQTRLRPAVQQQFGDGADYVQQLIREAEWVQAFRYINVLESAADTDEAKQAVAKLREMVNFQKKKIERDYALLGSRKKMYTEEDILEVRRVATHYLAIYPDHEEARALIEEAKQKGASRAKRLIRGAKLFKESRPSIYREKLTRAYHLARGGELGEKALAMLHEG